MTTDQLIKTLRRLDRLYAEKQSLPSDLLHRLVLDELYEHLVTSIETSCEGLRVVLSPVAGINRHVLLPWSEK